MQLVDRSYTAYKQSCLRPLVVFFSLLATRGREGKENGSPRAPLCRLCLNNPPTAVNCCYSRSQAEAIAEHVDCTVGMNMRIGDRAAIIFAASFYRALGFGRSVREAFEQGKVALLLGKPRPPRSSQMSQVFFGRELGGMRLLAKTRRIACRHRLDLLDQRRVRREMIVTVVSERPVSAGRLRPPSRVRCLVPTLA